MLKAVLDVNIYVSGAIKENGHSAQIFDRATEFIPCVSEAILKDLARVLHYPRIQKKFNLTEQDIARYLLKVRSTHLLSAGQLNVRIIGEDADDDIIIACALETRADYIVTGDPHLLNLKHFQGIQIVTPRAFLEILDRAK